MTSWSTMSSADVSPSLCIAHSSLRTVHNSSVQLLFLKKGEAHLLEFSNLYAKSMQNYL